MLEEKYSATIESFRFNNKIISKFSVSVSKTIEEEIIDLEKRYQHLLKLHKDYSKDLNENIGSKALSVIRVCNTQARVVFKMIESCRILIKDTISRIKKFKENS